MLSDFVLTTHVRTKDLRNDDAAIFLLEIFNKRYENARRCDSSVVERMDKAGLTVGRAIFYAEAARLIIGIMGARMRFTPAGSGRDPRFNVELFVLWQTQVAAAVQNHAVGEFELLHNLFRDCKQFLVLFFRLIRQT